ncbi:S41 family peptidase [Megamonas funiformis]|jgi:carboxyl-terminal processing protease|uniref:C-terminal processing peptidase n=1 Tax=Megamonas funiformis YIT 11815 TaxID=742816 RepID=A0ABP2NKY5_9FIRM|nr:MULTISPECIES: S41 family peptidase [Megamonas]EHR37634.1 C-terminal processing peptidase [Megamonas funiformis YIT 11815]MBS7212581.1 S41 family peptidase [Megamonas funiformis]QIB59674.1 S41 family peptidase [Megamonas funiformis]
MNKILKTIIAVLLIAIISSISTLGLIYYALGFNEQGFSNLMRFITAYRFIETKYVNDTDDVKLIDGAIDGMVKSLNDPHSNYLSPKMYKTLMEQTEGSFAGIGVVMGMDNEQKIHIVGIMENSPGQKAGLQEGDEILAVDGVPVTQMAFDEVAAHVRGQAGTDVVLTIMRDNANQDITITRDNIKLKTVGHKMLDNNIGYIQIVSFSEDTANEFNEAYNDLKNQGMKALVLDLRNNPGGLLTTCVEIAKKLVPKGEIVSIVDKQGNKETYSSSLEAPEYPLVVLINKNSASASEILSGAIQDTKSGTIIGNTSYGKGSVQTILPMFEDDAVKLTIAKYYTPSGRSIDGTGITPDIEINLDENATLDTQLDKALEVLKAQLNNN